MSFYNIRYLGVVGPNNNRFLYKKAIDKSSDVLYLNIILIKRRNYIKESVNNLELN